MQLPSELKNIMFAIFKSLSQLGRIFYFGWMRRFLLASMAIGILLAGCAEYQPEIANSILVDSSRGAVHPSKIIYGFDAGILFADCEQRFCFPLSRLGVDADEIVSSVDSSCHCADASIIEYQEVAGRTEKAINVLFRADSDLVESVSLSLQFRLHFEDGRERIVECRVVYVVSS
jgi:hypothetical protein